MAANATASAVVSRVAASLLGGYAFVWGFITLGIALLLAAGMPYDEARTLAYLLAFLVFLVVLLLGLRRRAAWRACGACWPAAARSMTGAGVAAAARAAA